MATPRSGSALRGVKCSARRSAQNVLVVQQMIVAGPREPGFSQRGSAGVVRTAAPDSRRWDRPVDEFVTVETIMTAGWLLTARGPSRPMRRRRSRERARGFRTSEQCPWRLSCRARWTLVIRVAATADSRHAAIRNVVLLTGITHQPPREARTPSSPRWVSPEASSGQANHPLGGCIWKRRSRGAVVRYHRNANPYRRGRTEGHPARIDILRSVPPTTAVRGSDSSVRRQPRVDGLFGQTRCNERTSLHSSPKVAANDFAALIY